jgi:hypothetical protein
VRLYVRPVARSRSSSVDFATRVHHLQEFPARTRPGFEPGHRDLQQSDGRCPTCRRPLGLRLGPCASPWRVAAHLRRVAGAKKQANLQVFCLWRDPDSHGDTTIFQQLGGPFGPTCRRPLGLRLGTLRASLARSRSLGARRIGKKTCQFAGAFGDGETRTRTGDTTIFSSCELPTTGLGSIRAAAPIRTEQRSALGQPCPEAGGDSPTRGQLLVGFGERASALAAAVALLAPHQPRQTPADRQVAHLNPRALLATHLAAAAGGIRRHARAARPAGQAARRSLPPRSRQAIEPRGG